MFPVRLPGSPHSLPIVKLVDIANRRLWRRRILRATLVLVVLGVGLGVLVFTRFHFSHQDFPILASWQGNDESLLGPDDPRPQIIGHRGSGTPAIDDGKPLGRDGQVLKGDDRPLLIGNTAAAIRRGIEAGVDWIEIDIRASSDKELVVFHDECLGLKTNANKDEQTEVENVSKEAMQELHVLVDPPARILSLEEVFSQFHSEERKWIFDIKAVGIQQEFLDWVGSKVSTGQLAEDQFVIFGRHDVLMDYRESGYHKGYTVTWGHEEGFGNRLRVLFTPSQLISRCDALGCRLLVLPAIFANPSLVDAARSSGINVWVYGSDDVLDHRHFAGRGISGLIVDEPERAMDCFAGRSPVLEPIGEAQPGRASASKLGGSLKESERRAW